MHLPHWITHTSMLPLLSSTIYLLIHSFNGVDARPVNTTITSIPTSDISALILADSVNATASSQRCGDIDNCRTMDDIVQSCLATILACAWFAVHRNIPAPKPMSATFARRVWRTVLDTMESLMVFLVAFLAPELVLAWAVRQATMAWKLSRKLEKARLKALDEREGVQAMVLQEEDTTEIAGSVEGHSSLDGSTPESERIQFINRRSNSSAAHAACTRCEGNGNQCNLVFDARRVAKGDECWTWLHGFFVVMGGFHWYDKDGPLYPLSPANVLELVARGHLVPPTTDDISDKSKGDWLSKGVAIVQTAWFVVQCIARHAEGLPVTRLEVMTLAYTVVTVAMYVVWWKKPLSVSCAVRVPKEEVAEEDVRTYTSIWHKIGIYVIGHQDFYVDLHKRKGVPTFWAGRPDIGALGPSGHTVFVAMAFGAVHYIAWHSKFQSHLEQELWRLSAIAIVALPPALIVPAITAYLCDAFGLKRKYILLLRGVLFAAIAFVYITARVILIILSFTSLRGLPYAAYKTIQWTTFIPHI